MKKKIDLNFYKTAVKLALPIAMQNLLTSCAALIDTAMVVGLGDASVSAIGAAGRYSFLLNVICFGFASGCTSLLSQYWGANERTNLKKTFGFALLISMSFSLIYALMLALYPKALMFIFTDNETIAVLGSKYLRIYSIAVPFIVFAQTSCFAFRSIEKVNIPLISSVTSVCVNVFLNYCLIDGNLGFPAMGLEGAALASVTGYITQALIMFAFLIFEDNPLKGKFSEMFSFSGSFCKKYLKIAAPVLLNESFWALGTNVYVMVIGRQGTENHAGYTLYENVQQLFFVFFVGICGACAIMIGKSIGAGDKENGYKIAKRFAIMTPLAGVVMGITLCVTCVPLLSLFEIETEAARSAAIQCLRVYGIWLPMRMIPYTLICGIFRAGGDTLAGCILDMTGLYICGIPAVLITGLLIKPENFVTIIIVMFVAEDTIKGILGAIHFFSKKWIKQLTTKEAVTAITKTDIE